MKPVLRLSTQLRIAAEMASPEIRGLARMMLEDWVPEAERMEERIAELEKQLDEAVKLLDDARPDFNDTELRSKWSRRRKTLRGKVHTS
jgi:hypothetical protein